MSSSASSARRACCPSIFGAPVWVWLILMLSVTCMSAGETVLSTASYAAQHFFARCRWCPVCTDGRSTCDKQSRLAIVVDSWNPIYPLCLVCARLQWYQPWLCRPAFCVYRSSIEAGAWRGSSPVASMAAKPAIASSYRRSSGSTFRVVVLERAAHHSHSLPPVCHSAPCGWAGLRWRRGRHRCLPQARHALGGRAECACLLTRWCPSICPPAPGMPQLPAAPQPDVAGGERHCCGAAWRRPHGAARGVGVGHTTRLR